jgi:multiple sugar transport system permease protein
VTTLGRQAPIEGDRLRSSSVGAQPKSTRRKVRRSPTVYFWLLAPALAVAVGFTIFPLVRTFSLSFTNLDLSGQADWIGTDNYARMLGDGLFWQSVGVSGVFLVVGVVLELVIAWTLALLLADSVSRLNNVLRTLFAIPMLLSPVVIGITWRVLLNPQFGWINAILQTPGMDWVGDPSKSLWVLIAVDVWQWTPFLFLMLSAGLVGIPGEVKEAARLDGANGLGILRHITFPLMLPVTLVAILLRSIDSTKTFELPFTLTSGGPGNTTTTVAIFMYRRAFSEFDQGYASALAVTITLALVIFAMIYLRIVRRVEGKFG